MSTVFRNLTPHNIAFFDANSVSKKGMSFYLKNDEEPLFSVTPEIPGGARAAQEEEHCGYLTYGSFKIGLYSMSYGQPIGLPEDVKADDVIIVSKITADAAFENKYKYINNLYLTAHAVRNADGQIIGCTDLAPYCKIKKSWFKSLLYRFFGSI